MLPAEPFPSFVSPVTFHRGPLFIRTVLVQYVDSRDFDAVMTTDKPANLTTATMPHSLHNMSDLFEERVILDYLANSAIRILGAGHRSIKTRIPALT